MMKIVPARRRVSEASLEPPSIDCSRAISPECVAVADRVSITATGRIRKRPQTTAAIRRSNDSLRFGWARRRGTGKASRRAALRQVDIELVGALAADQGQFQRRAFRVGARWQPFEIEREALDPGRALVEQ